MSAFMHSLRRSVFVIEARIFKVSLYTRLFALAHDATPSSLDLGMLQGAPCNYLVASIVLAHVGRIRRNRSSVPVSTRKQLSFWL